MIRKASPSNKIKTAVVEEGVAISPMPATAGEIVTINYDGLLAKSGVAKVYAHIGYGSSDNWKQVEDIVMSDMQGTWNCQVLPKGERLNFCFHDGANNWDNNNGHNWSIAIHDGHTYH